MRLAIAIALVAAGLLVCLGPSEAQPTGAAEIRVEKAQIQFMASRQVVTTYQTKDSWPRPFFWPLRTVDGTDTTRAWPMGEALPIEGKKPDHIHHRSVWFTYGDVVPEGMTL